MNILFIRPPIIEVFTPYDSIDYTKPLQSFHAYGSQPAGLLRVASYFKKKGHTVTMMDCCAELPKDRPNSVLRWKPWGKIKTGSGTYMERRFRGLPYDEIEKELIRERPDVIMIGATMTYYCETAHETVRLCQKVHPNVPVIIGGLYATLCPEHALSSGADGVYIGEIRDANNIANDLSILPYKPTYAIVKSTRGCPNQCTYCVVPKLEGRGMRYRAVNEVVDEIQSKYDSGIRRFIFWESNLLINSKNHFEVILDEIIRRKLKVTLETPEGLAPKFITLELAMKMRKAGFKRLFIPLETTDDKYNKKVLKRTALVSEFDNAISILKKAGFKSKSIKIFVLIGLPGQSYDNVLDSIQKTYEVGCTLCIMPFTPIPKSGEYEKHADYLKGKRYEELHPLLLSMVRDESIRGQLIRLGSLNNKGLGAEHIDKKLKGLKIKDDIIKRIKENPYTLDRVIEEGMICKNFRFLFSTTDLPFKYIKKGMRVAVIGKDTDNIRAWFGAYHDRTKYDVIIDTGEMLYFSPIQRRKLIARIKNSLKQNGLFITKFLLLRTTHFQGNAMWEYMNPMKPTQIKGMKLIQLKERFFVQNNNGLAPGMIEAVYRKD